jgi:hypothetical protein
MVWAIAHYLQWWGLHAPRPPWDLAGIVPPNSGVMKRINLMEHKRTMRFTPLIRSGQPYYLSDDLIPGRMLPSRATYASDHPKISDQILNKIKYL